MTDTKRTKTPDDCSCCNTAEEKMKNSYSEAVTMAMLAILLALRKRDADREQYNCKYKGVNIAPANDP